MNIVAWLVVGGLIGWQASVILQRMGQPGIMLNVVVGSVGAVLTAWILTPNTGGAMIDTGIFSAAGLLVSSFGAVVLFGIVSLFRRGRAR